jgi:hypothetical protein
MIFRKSQEERDLGEIETDGWVLIANSKGGCRLIRDVCTLNDEELLQVEAMSNSLLLQSSTTN